MTIQSGAFLNRRCPYQAAVMKTFDAKRSTTVVIPLGYPYCDGSSHTPAAGSNQPPSSTHWA